MAINREKYIPKYIDEALENIGITESLLFEIKDGVSAEDDLATVLRALHTLKSTSRMLEFNRIEAMAHSMESVFIAIKEQRIALSDNAMKLLLASIDMIKTGLSLAQKTKYDSIDTNAFERELAALAANEEYNLIDSKPPEPEPKAKTEPAEPKALPESAKTPEEQKRPEAGAAAASGKTQAAKLESAKSESIRIPLEKINNIIKNAASLQSLEIAAKAAAMESAALNDMIKAFSRVLRTDKSADKSLFKNFQKLERLHSKITQSLKNDAADTSNQTKNVYDSIISLRMLPISTILDTYPRYVYELATELGKKVQLAIEGSENEIDKNIIESLSDVFLHMVRNSVDHGIESPDERLASGKSETGRLTINCSRESGSIKIVISDDGKGIDHESIRSKAVKSGYLTEAAAAALSKEELVNIIFQSGFSTSGTVSNISGRGVGMDAVRSNIEQLKGTILVNTAYGQGTSFTILLPISITAITGFPVSAGDMKFIIPANFVDNVLLINRDDIITVIDRPEIRYQDRIIKLYYLEQILRIKNKDIRPPSGMIFVIIIHAYDDVIALVTDSVDSMRSVILKPMPAFMETMPVFSGMVLSEDYEMIPALHMPSIIKMAKRIKGIDMKKRDLENKKMRKSILVVDDSLPTREIESEILRSEGYKVDTAADGAEAFSAAKTNRYDLICTDLNMPQMDGFMLTENIRKNDELSNIPIIVISSRESEEDQRRAAMLGASRYIIKNSFNNHNLLTAVQELIGEANE
ncbi:MAG: response regulator [Spirochaetia bacterium]|jgi:chemotaxis protein histidine kinase CheA/ActR/RegA family two-component response regulator|nr:response regulator [Spirochaetia bacterium]